MQDQTTTTEFYAIVELMGHQKIAGKLTEQVLGGSSFIRVDVPELPDSPAFTRLLTDKAIYAINPVTEEVARHMAQQIKAQPIQAWDARMMIELHLEQSGKRIGQGAEDTEFDEDDVLKSAYRQKVKQHHPDNGGDADRFQRVQQAYQEALRDITESINHHL